MARDHRRARSRSWSARDRLRSSLGVPEAPRMDKRQQQHEADLDRGGVMSGKPMVCIETFTGNLTDDGTAWVVFREGQEIAEDDDAIARWPQFFAPADDLHEQKRKRQIAQAP